MTQLPEPIPAEKIKRRSELEQKQRNMERKIRRLKRFCAGTLDPDTAKAYQKKLRQAEQELKEFVEKHSDILRRDYEREKIYGGGVDKSGESGIIKTEKAKHITINSIDKSIETPIEQKHTGKGNPNAVLTFGAELNNRQKHLLEQLAEFDSKIIVGKNEVNMADLSAFTAQTGHEFAMFTKSNERLIIRGNATMVNIDIEQAKELAKQGYRWSGHTHPGSDINCLIPSRGDKEILREFKQNTSVIYNSKGQYATFEKE